MRTIPLNGMLTSLSTNYNRRNKNVRLYELGNIYLPKQLPVTELPMERMQFTLGMYGEGDFYTLKGVAEEFLLKIGMNDKISYRPDSARPYLEVSIPFNGIVRIMEKSSPSGLEIVTASLNLESAGIKSLSNTFGLSKE